MADANTLEELYVSLLADTLSANEQMLDIVEELADEVENDKLRQMLEKTVEKIPQHNEKLEALLEKRGGEALEEHCRGMEGLVEEAREHALDLDTDDDAVRDAAIIHAMQQMSHYGMAGYGTAAALAQALGYDDDAEALRADLKEIFNADEYLSVLAETQVNRKAA